MVTRHEKQLQQQHLRDLMPVAHRARLLQLPLLLVVPAAAVGMTAATLAPGYDVDPWPTVCVPAGLILLPLLALALSWNWHRRLRPTGYPDSWHFYAEYRSGIGWLARLPLVAVLPVEGVVLVVAGAGLRGDPHTVLDGAGWACVASAVFAALSWMLGGWVLVLELMGEGLIAGGLRPSPLSRRQQRVLAAGPPGLMVGAILAALALPFQSVPLAVVGAVVLAVALVATFRLGLGAGYRPPGEGDARARAVWIALCLVGAVLVVLRFRWLWSHA